ncbi:Rha family transcriptional regulator [Solidesulfovibrio sp.]
MASASVNNPDAGGNALLSPTLSVVAGRPVVSSLDVAEHFGKRHDHVIRNIQAIICNTPESFSAPNFGAANYVESFSALNFKGADYIDAQGKKRLRYDLTRDGFTLLAMGFTGKKALAWKIRYIAAFNAMEAELSAGRDADVSDASFLRRLSRLNADTRAGLLRLAQRIKGRGSEQEAVLGCYRALVEEITADMPAGELMALPGDAPWAADIEDFLAQRCTVAPGLKVQAGKLYVAFENWSRGKGFANPPSSIAFGRVLRRRFLQDKSNVFWWHGLALTESVGQAAPAVAKGVMQ